MGGGLSAQAYVDFVEAVHRGDRDVYMNLCEKKKFNPCKKDKQGRFPLIEAAAWGCRDAVFHIVQEENLKRFKLDRKGKNKQMLSQALVAACSGKTDSKIVSRLVEHGADCNFEDTTAGEHSLLCLARKTSVARCGSAIGGSTCSNQDLAERRLAASIVLNPPMGKGASFPLKNLDEMTAIQICCQENNYQLAKLLLEKGASIMDVHMFSVKGGALKKSFVASSMLSEYAFENEKYKSWIKKQFMQKFDNDENGALDDDEFVQFLAGHVKMMFNCGIKVVNSFDDDGSMDVDLIKSLLEKREPQFIQMYRSHVDHDGDGKYTYAELEPMVKEFYTNMWTSSSKGARPDNFDEGSMYDEIDHVDETGGAADEGLPPGWVMTQDPNTGKTYYANAATGQSSWTIPTA